MKPQNNIHMQEKKGSKFLNGLFWGAILGSGVAYVLSSKKRREIAKDLINQGVDLLENATVSQKAEVEKILNPIPSDKEEILIEKEAVKSSEPHKKAVSKRFFKKAAKEAS